jgi:DNA-3-methyladenine glycosylase
VRPLPVSEAVVNRPDGRVLEAGFFARPSSEVGPELIGKIVWRRGVGGGRLTEVEAYLPEDDPACHAARGRTRRNAAMFGPPGTIYVFRSYGIHWLLNLVCERQGVGSAVLVRSFEPLGDSLILRRNRGLSPKQAGVNISRGPGRVGQALGVDPELNGAVLGGSSGVFVLDDGQEAEVGCATRVGISVGAGLLLRYYEKGSRYVSMRPGSKRGKQGERG